MRCAFRRDFHFRSSRSSSVERVDAIECRDSLTTRFAVEKVFISDHPRHCVFAAHF